MKAILAFDVLLAASAVRAVSSQTHDDIKPRDYCYTSKFDKILDSEGDPIKLAVHDNLSFAHWDLIDLTTQANPTVQPASPPNAIQAIMEIFDTASFDPKKMAMVARIHVGLEHRHFHLKAFNFACLNTGKQCLIVILGTMTNGTRVEMGEHWWNVLDQPDPQMARVVLPAPHADLVEVQFAITRFEYSTSDPVLLLDNIHHCGYAGEIGSLGVRRIGLLNDMEGRREELEQDRPDRIDAFNARRHENGQQHDGKKEL